MRCVNDATFPELPSAMVRTSRCDGCAFCVDVCPTNALAVTANPARPGRRIVAVIEERCRGCGVCQATCPKEAITIPGLSADDLRGYIRLVLEDAE